MHFLTTLFVVLTVFSSVAAKADSVTEVLSETGWVCPPCPHVDSLFQNTTHKEDGQCEICGMALVENPKGKMLNEIVIHDGSGNFVVEGSNSASHRPVVVFYYKPANLQHNSQILLVLPGAGRNAWDYRDSWIKAAEEHNVLILALHYAESFYPRFWNYNLGRMIDNVTINQQKTAIAEFTFTAAKDEWIYRDFDRIFSRVRSHMGLSTQTYDLFGHSAGGQILHRLALFHRSNNANRILASNSGWYTATDFQAEFPYGLKASGLSVAELASAFQQKLILFIGELDNENETRGHLVRNPDLDKQGTHRLARAQYFYDTAKQHAKTAELDFKWQLQLIPGVGHDYKRMSQAAADYLYQSQ
ncbi:MAG: hypothetical protein ACFHVJ_05355 [Aestuariibacter sp.]